MKIKNKLQRTKQYMRQHGLKETIKKIFQKIYCFVKIHFLESKENKEQSANYISWQKNNEPNEDELNLQNNTKFSYEPKISIVVPMYHTKQQYLEELVECIIAQTYSNWELCLADGSTEEAEYVKRIVAQDERIHYKFLNGNKGISENSNAAIQMTTGDYIALLDHDDILPKHSLYEVVKCINENPEAEFIYTDEDKLYEKKELRLGHHFKQDFAIDTLMSYNYICHFSIIKKELMYKVQGFRKEFDGAQDYDLIFRLVENTKNIVHIPKILYHWRMNINSVALNSDAKPYAYIAAKDAIQAHLDRNNIPAKVEDGHTMGIFQVKYELQNNPKVSILIYFNNSKLSILKKCINSIKKSEYSNYEILLLNGSNKATSYFKEVQNTYRIIQTEENSYVQLHNKAVQEAKGEYIIFVDSNIEVETKNWIQKLVANAQRKDVGMVGTRIYYNDGTIYHAGITLGLQGLYGYVYKNKKKQDIGYMNRIEIQQNCSAVTSKLCCISKQNYELINGMDNAIEDRCTEVDLCLKLQNIDKLIVYNPIIEAKYFGKKDNILIDKKLNIKFYEKWKEILNRPDPYYNINFRKDILDIKINPNKVG